MSAEGGPISTSIDSLAGQRRVERTKSGMIDIGASPLQSIQRRPTTRNPQPAVREGPRRVAQILRDEVLEL